MQPVESKAREILQHFIKFKRKSQHRFVYPDSVRVRNSPSVLSSRRTEDVSAWFERTRDGACALLFHQYGATAFGGCSKFTSLNSTSQASATTRTSCQISVPLK